MITLRRAQLTDVAFLTQAETACFSDPFPESSLRDSVKNDWMLSLLAEEDGAPIGYLLASLIGGEGEVIRVATLPAFRGRGAARLLLSHLLSHCDACFLEVREGNRSARTLYESLGFLPTGERKNYYKCPVENAALYKWTKG